MPASKSFRYHTEPSEIRKFIMDLGYQVDNSYSLEGKEIGFTVGGTKVQLSYDLIIDGSRVAYGTVSTMISVKSLEETERSEKLYQKLKRKFGKPPAKNQ